MPLSEKVQDKTIIKEVKVKEEVKEEKVMKKDNYRGRAECYYLPLLWWGK